MLGLAAGGATRGAAYRVAEADWDSVYVYLREREQPTETYMEAWRDVRFADGAVRRALVFLSDRAHPQWAGRLSLERQRDLIAGAAGLSGRNVDYLRDLVSHLKDRGIGVLITDHNVRETLEIIDRAYILHDGQVLMEGRPEEVVANSEVRRVYLGEKFSL